MSKSESLSLKAPRAQKGLSFTLSPPALVGSIIALCGGFILVFAVGIMLGRGHNLETKIPELERIMPERAVNTPVYVIADGEGNVPDADENGFPSANDKVIAQGDLGYREHLKKTTSSQSKKNVQTAESKAPIKKVEKKEAASKPVPVAQKINASSPQPKAGTTDGETVAGIAPEKAAKPPQPAGSADMQKYHYVYQAAAYKEAAACDAFTSRLVAAGFKARSQRTESDGVIWYRTMIDFTGRPDDTDALRERLKGFGIPKVLLKSKVAVQ